ncbi:TonB-dependent receptor [Parapedobacter indicus]|uniref:TonB-linked outer membrane protein, SusC/RagA family n=1 Tax=Parapedobacter indicus TaxID=1477437 RepID=A0A1I3LJA9_9SPHI|nr:TonB-dependent receptor [Parapedobacter indicus]PPL01468.1 TonB-linked SusC/RagA family outer membrane protein [Parapedobacter indicus]SFI84879.1 TonB-linked outer membrane protein, SusC/RagA family [Parapedobacter indicus]
MINYVLPDGRTHSCPAKNQLLRVMRITGILLLIGSLHLSAASLSQTITLKVKRQPIEQLFDEIEKQTGYWVVYSDQLMKSANPITIDAKDMPLPTFLTQVLKPQALTYTIDGKNILIMSDGTLISKVEHVLENKPKDIQIQQQTVRGIVRDEQGTPLEGVTITVSGSSIATTSLVNGEFQISVDEADKTLIFSAVGFETRELILKGQSTVSVTLKAAISDLDEVVVVGYGTQKRATLTGSVATTKGEDLAKSPAVNLSNSLAGRLPGVIASNTSGLPGTGASILIRGQSTLGNNAPLIVIDGVWDRSGLGQINPNDVASISVLKDASAAIYGAQAANGVILVTTKRGQIGKPTISYSLNQGFSQPTRLAKMADAPSYAVFMNELLVEQGQSERFTQEEIEKMRVGSDPIRYPNTNWQKAALKDFSSQTQQNLSVNGGNENVTYYISGNLANQNSILKNSDLSYKNYSIRSNVDARISAYIKVSLDLTARQEQQALPSVDPATIFHSIWRTYPFLPVYNPDGSFAPGIERGENPLVMSTNATGYKRNLDNIYQTTFNYEVVVPWVDGLKIDGFVAHDRHFRTEKLFRIPWEVYNYNPDTDVYTKQLGGPVAQPDLRQTFLNSSRTTINARLNYDASFEGHTLSTFIAAEQTETTGSDFWAYRRDYLSGAIDQLYAGGAENKDNSGSAYEIARRNFFGRLNYEFKGRYLIDFNFRYDGSQNFPAGRRFGFFPGVSVGWRLSEEDFLDQWDFLNNLKLRASIGKMGNDQVDAFQFLSTYSFGEKYYFADPAISLSRGVTPNPNITWEVAHALNIGLDASLWEEMLGIELDVFRTRRNNILTARNASIPVYTGLVLPNENIGVVENKGFEAQVYHSNRKQKAEFGYRIGANVAFAKNKIIDIDEAENQQPWQMRTGYPMGTSLYYDAIGIFRSAEEIETSPHPVGTKVGDLKYRDVNNDGVIDAKDQIRNELTNVPQLTFGFTADVSYKRFSLHALFQGQAKAEQYLFLQSGLAGNSLQEWLDNRYTPENPQSSFPRLPTYEAEISGYRSTFWVRDATFVRLKNLQLSYSFPVERLARLKIKTLSIYLNGFNLFTLDKLKYFDPEGRSETGAFYPQEKIYNLGLHLSF